MQVHAWTSPPPVSPPTFSPPPPAADRSRAMHRRQQRSLQLNQRHRQYRFDDEEDDFGWRIEQHQQHQPLRAPPSLFSRPSPSLYNTPRSYYERERDVKKRPRWTHQQQQRERRPQQQQQHRVSPRPPITTTTTTEKRHRRMTVSSPRLKTSNKNIRRHDDDDAAYDDSFEDGNYPDKHINNDIGWAAGLGSGVVGAMVAGLVGAVVAGFGTAYFATSTSSQPTDATVTATTAPTMGRRRRRTEDDDDISSLSSTSSSPSSSSEIVRDAARAMGKVTLTAIDQAQQLNEQHQLMDKAMDVAEEAWDTAQELDRQYRIVQTAKDVAIFGGKATIDFCRDHHVVERSVQGIGTGVGWVVDRVKAGSLDGIPPPRVGQVEEEEESIPRRGIMGPNRSVTAYNKSSQGPSPSSPLFSSSSFPNQNSRSIASRIYYEPYYDISAPTTTRRNSRMSPPPPSRPQPPSSPSLSSSQAKFVSTTRKKLRPLPSDNDDDNWRRHRG